MLTPIMVVEMVGCGGGGGSNTGPAGNRSFRCNRTRTKFTNGNSITYGHGGAGRASGPSPSSQEAGGGGGAGGDSAPTSPYLIKIKEVVLDIKFLAHPNFQQVVRVILVQSDRGSTPIISRWCYWNTISRVEIFWWRWWCI